MKQLNKQDDNTGESAPFRHRLNRMLRWAFINGLLGWCAWEAVINSNTGAGRILVFVAWLCAFAQFSTACFDDLKKVSAEKGRSVPAWISHGYGIALLGLLIWNGWWWTAIAVMIMEIGEAIIFDEPNTKDKPPESPTESTPK